MLINEITSIILEECVAIHKKLGPGLLESVYEEVLSHRLMARKLRFDRQISIPVYYENKKMGIGFRADLIVEGKVIVELKSVEQTHPVYAKILLTYLRLSGISVGLIINFNEVLLRKGITRIVNNYKEET
jgi:GxxExxY protein